MNAELTIKFKNIPENLLQIIQQSFSSKISLENVIANSIYSDRIIYHDCFLHGFQTTEIIILFQIIGNDLIVHLETPNTNNVFITLKNKINSYYKNIIQKLKNNKIEIKELKPEVIIIAEGTYLFTGSIPSKGKEFLKQLDRDKFRLIILPFVLVVMNFTAYKFKIMENFNNAMISFISQIIAVTLWYLFEHFSLIKSQEFKFQNINE